MQYLKIPLSILMLAALSGKSFSGEVYVNQPVSHNVQQATTGSLKTTAVPIAIATASSLLNQSKALPDTGSTNVSLISQTGSQNSAMLAQIGGGNLSYIVQQGSQNTAIVSQRR